VGIVHQERLPTKASWFYATELEAAKAYDKAAAETFGEFARLNFPEDYA
jgi:hypothetical protein